MKKKNNNYSVKCAFCKKIFDGLASRNTVVMCKPCKLKIKKIIKY